jgi:alanine dehydrogenase
MRIGVPKEIKPGERRIGLAPAGIRELTGAGHEVVVEAGAGKGSGISDDEIVAAGGSLGGVADVWRADLIVKVKEPQLVEVDRLRPGQILFTYLHLAAEPELADGLRRSGATCIAYETIEDEAGRLPLLAPMSEVAGRLATLLGAGVMTAPQGGPGLLVSGIPGVEPARVAVIGGGVAGTSAAMIAAGLGAEVEILDVSIPRLRELEARFGNAVRTRHATAFAIERAAEWADMVVGAVLVRGARAPHVLNREQVARLRPGTVLVDISIDQGGCFETSRPTSHADPTYVVDGVIHYCVANIPGAAPITATHGLTAATLPYVARLAAGGIEEVERDPLLRKGLTVAGGEIVHPVVAADLAALEAAA